VQLLRFLRALPTIRVLPELDGRTLTAVHSFIFDRKINIIIIIIIFTKNKKTKQNVNNVMSVFYSRACEKDQL